MQPLGQSVGQAAIRYQRPPARQAQLATVGVPPQDQIEAIESPLRDHVGCVHKSDGGSFVLGPGDVRCLVAAEVGVVHACEPYAAPCCIQELGAVRESDPPLFPKPALELFDPRLAGRRGRDRGAQVLQVTLVGRHEQVVGPEHVEPPQLRSKRPERLEHDRNASILVDHVPGQEDEVDRAPEADAQGLDPALEMSRPPGHVRVGEVEDRQRGAPGADLDAPLDQPQPVWLQQGVGAETRPHGEGGARKLHRFEHTGIVRLSLRYKIVGGFVLLLSLIGLLGWVTYSLFGSLREVQTRVFDDAVPGLVVAAEVVRSYTAQSAAIRGYLINSRREQLEQYREEVRQVAVTESRARALFDSPRERTLLAELIEAGKDFHREVDKRVLPIAKKGDRALAFNRLGREGDSAVADIERLGQQLRRTQDRVMARNQRGLQDRSAQALAILLLVTIGAVLIGLLLAIVVSRRLVQGLHQLVDAARAVGRGDFDQTIDIRTGDEVEELATRFTEMQAGLKRLQQLALHDQELEIAASIQRNLLQKSVPHTPEVHLAPMQRQANLVGGDWFDVDSSDGRLAIVVGDASGKGIGAALMATVALSALRAERGLGGDGRRIVSRANRALVDATDPESYATVIYLDLELSTGEATWLNMGHPPPFILRASGTRDGPRGHYLEGPRNRVLGWFDDPGLEQGSVKVLPGDRLVLYTDGWLEAKSVDGETFGEHRFAEALTRLGILGGEALVEELVREVERFAAGKLDDDLTMLVVEFLGAPVGRAGVELTGEEQWHSRR